MWPLTADTMLHDDPGALRAPGRAGWFGVSRPTGAGGDALGADVGQVCPVVELGQVAARAGGQRLTQLGAFLLVPDQRIDRGRLRGMGTYVVSALGRSVHDTQCPSALRVSPARMTETKHYFRLPGNSRHSSF